MNIKKIAFGILFVVFFIVCSFLGKQIGRINAENLLKEKPPATTSNDLPTPTPEQMRDPEKFVTENRDQVMIATAENFRKTNGPFPNKLADNVWLINMGYFPDVDTLIYVYELQHSESIFTDSDIKTMETRARDDLINRTAPKLRKVFDIGCSVEWVYFCKDSDDPLFIIRINPDDLEPKQPDKNYLTIDQIRQFKKVE